MPAEVTYMALDPERRNRSASGRRPQRDRAAPRYAFRPRRPPIRQFVAAARDRDLDSATRLALAFLAQTESRMRLFTDLFHAAQQQIEERWHVGEATVEDEYAVYLAVEHALTALPPPPIREPQAGAPAILLATVKPEEHDLGLRLLAASFVEAGWSADVRPGIDGPELIAAAARENRRLVGISATFLSRQARAALAATVVGLKAAGAHVLGGGAAFDRSPALGREMGIDMVATDARLAVLYAGRLVRMPRVLRTVS